MGKGVWGIDVSRYSVKAVRLEQTKDGVHLTDIEVIPYQVTGKIEEAELETKIREALKQLKYSRRVGSEPVVLSLPTHTAQSRLVKLPPFEDIAVAIQHEAKQQIPSGLDQVIWDYQIVERQYQTGEEKDVILLFMKKDTVQNFLKIVEEVGLNIDQIQISPVAIYNFLAYDQDMSQPTVVLEMGADNASLIVVENERFWIRNIPVAGNDITKAIQEAFNTTFEKADQLKINAMNSPQVEKIYESVLPVYKNIISEIHRSLGYYKSMAKQAKFDRIMLLGNGTKSLNFQRFMGQALNMQALKVQRLNKINLAAGLDADLLNRQMQSIETAMGLALQGCGLTKNKVNLLPEEYRKRKESRKKYPVVAVAIAVLYGTLFWAYTETNKRIEDLAKTLKESEVARAAEQVKKDYEEASKVDAIKNELEALGKIGVDRSYITKLMEEIFKRFPANNNALNVPDKDKIWLIDMDVSLWDGDKPNNKQPGGMALQSAMVQTKRTLSFVMNVAITHQMVDRVGATQGGSTRNPAEGQQFVGMKLGLDKLTNDSRPIPKPTIEPVGLTDNLKPDAGSGMPAATDGKFLKYRVKFDIDLPPPQK